MRGYGRLVAPRTVTRSIESEADPDVVVELLANPRRIPDWAPDFADAVSEDGHAGWTATKNSQDFALRVVIQRDAGTVDYLRQVAPGREGGAYLRATPRPAGGSVIVMTVPVPADSDPVVVDATVSDELAALSLLAVSR